MTAASWSRLRAVVGGGEPVHPDDGQGEVVPDACAVLGGEQVVGHGGEEGRRRLVAGRGDVAEVDDSVDAVDCLVETGAGGEVAVHQVQPVRPALVGSSGEDAWVVAGGDGAPGEDAARCPGAAGDEEVHGWVPFDSSRASEPWRSAGESHGA